MNFCAKPIHHLTKYIYSRVCLKAVALSAFSIIVPNAILMHNPMLDHLYYYYY